MKESNHPKDGYHFDSERGPQARTIAQQQLQYVDYGSDRHFGIIDQASQCFVCYKEEYSSFADIYGIREHPEWPSRHTFDRLIQPEEKRFIDKSLKQIHEYLDGIPETDYPNNRLLLDLCMGSDPKHCLRLLIRIRYLSPKPEFPAGLCLYGAHIVSQDQEYTKPLRDFRTGLGDSPTLFKTDENIICDVPKSLRTIFDELERGLSYKQIAHKLGNCEKTIQNTMYNFRKKLKLCSSDQLRSYYDHLR